MEMHWISLPRSRSKLDNDPKILLTAPNIASGDVQCCHIFFKSRFSANNIEILFCWCQKILRRLLDTVCLQLKFIRTLRITDGQLWQMKRGWEIDSYPSRKICTLRKLYKQSRCFVIVSVRRLILLLDLFNMFYVFHSNQIDTVEVTSFLIDCSNCN